MISLLVDESLSLSLNILILAYWGVLIC